MKNGIYSIKDVKVGFMSPFVQPNDLCALRGFKDAINDSKPNQVNRYPEDMELWKLGEMDDITGVIVPEVHHLAKAVDYMEVK